MRDPRRRAAGTEDVVIRTAVGPWVDETREEESERTIVIAPAVSPRLLPCSHSKRVLVRPAGRASVEVTAPCR
jgi:hypothetical protein